MALLPVSISDLEHINSLTLSFINDGESFYSTNLQADSLPSEPPGKYGMCCACMPAQSLSCSQLFTTRQIIARQAPLSAGFSRQEYWSGSPCPPPGALPCLPSLLHWQVGSFPYSHLGSHLLNSVSLSLTKCISLICNIQENRE